MVFRNHDLEGKLHIWRSWHFLHAPHNISVFLKFLLSSSLFFFSFTLEVFFKCLAFLGCLFCVSKALKTWFKAKGVAVARDNWLVDLTLGFAVIWPGQFITSEWQQIFFSFCGLISFSSDKSFNLLPGKHIPWCQCSLSRVEQGARIPLTLLDFHVNTHIYYGTFSFNCAWCLWVWSLPDSASSKMESLPEGI